MRLAKVLLFCVELLERNGVPADEAHIIVNSLIEADLKGLGSHGLMRLPIYIKRINAGLMKAKAELVVTQDTGASAVLDANFSAGQVAAREGMSMAINKADQLGVGACLVKNSGHFGMAASYGLQAAAKNMIGIVLSNTTPLMPVPGGAEKKLGNNPLAIVIPTKSEPIIVDMALSNVALGKILVAKNKGVPIPIDWATDKEGNTTDDPAKALDGGFLLPMAGPKGYSLAVAVEVLTGVLAGCFAWQIPSLYNLSSSQSIAHFLLAIDVSKFINLDDYFAHIAAFQTGIKGSAKAPGVNEVFLPGEIELGRRAASMKEEAFLMPDAVITEINELAGLVGMALLERGRQYEI